ncbi:Gfo/Idh/MocA family oxidoreductase [Microbacterium lushaniae]|uniref:Gfo/Idh/MocA family oxidoreductase n=1 Tax=Microbacterium lushaniae TaxID=2614639 RepID=A0A5J6L0I5_9MICO|nr:Gfo/Idh/MocA family oxidoreductase [Microbacterium lushaniae]
MPRTRATRIRSSTTTARGTAWAPGRRSDGAGVPATIGTVTSTTAQRTRWAILGPGAISRDFLAGLHASRSGMLAAVGSTDPGRAERFAADAGAPFSGSYDEVLARPDIDAVYVGTVHTTHADLAIRALEAGKAVLCEKPASPTAAEVDRILAAAEAADRPFVEAYKNRFGPWADALRQVLADGAVGRPVRVEAAFGFDAGTRSGRLFDPALAGGAILDVGCYPVSLAVEAASASRAVAPDAVVVADAAGELVGGVDGESRALIRFGAVEGALATSIVRDLPSSAVIHCTGGAIELPDAWGGRAESPTTIVVRPAEGEPTVVSVRAVQPMAAEADALSRALAEGRREAPEMPWAHTRAVAAALTAWRSRIVPSAP